MNSSNKILIIILLVIFCSCSRVLNINLSKSEIKSLDTIYYLKKNHKFFDTEWVFLEKNICQMSTIQFRKKTYTGTWSKEGDSIKISFFYNKKNAPTNSMIAIKDLKQ